MGSGHSGSPWPKRRCSPPQRRGQVLTARRPFCAVQTAYASDQITQKALPLQPGHSLRTAHRRDRPGRCPALVRLRVSPGKQERGVCAPVGRREASTACRPCCRRSPYRCLCVQGGTSMPPRRRRQQAAAQAVSEASLAGLPPDVLQVGRQGSVVALHALLTLRPPHVQAALCGTLLHGIPSADHWRPPGGPGQAVQPRNCSPGHRFPGHDLTVRGGSCKAVCCISHCGTAGLVA